MKTLLQYIFEHTSLADTADKLAVSLVAHIQKDSKENKDKTIFSYPVKLKGKSYTLHIKLDTDAEHAKSLTEQDAKTITSVFLDNKGDAKEALKSNLYIILNPDSFKAQGHSELAHEIRHALDFVTKGTRVDDDTYTDKEVAVFDGFLYALSATERNAFYVSFKSALKEKDSKTKELIEQLIEKTKVTSVDDLLKAVKTDNLFATRAAYVKEHGKKKDIDRYKDVYDWSCVDKDDKEGKYQNPFKIAEFKNSILKDENSFEQFINKDEIDGKDREDETKNMIIQNLSHAVGSKEPISDVKVLYKKVSTIYKQTYNQYIQLIKNTFKLQ